MYLSRSSKPLKPYKPGAQGIVADKKPVYPGAQPTQQYQPKESKIRVPGKNVPKRKPRIQTQIEPVEEEYDVGAVQNFINRQGAPEPDPSTQAKPVKSSKIGLPKKTSVSSKIQPKGAVKKAPEPAEDPKKALLKKQKDEQLLNKLITSVEPQSDESDDDDLIQEALDGEYDDDSHVETHEDDDDLMNE